MLCSFLEIKAIAQLDNSILFEIRQHPAFYVQEIKIQTISIVFPLTENQLL